MNHAPATARNRESAETLNVLGQTYRLLRTHADPGSPQAVVEIDIPPGAAVPLHRHLYEDEVFYVVSGELTVHAESKVLRLGPGGCAHAPRGCPHAYANFSSSTCRVLLVVTPGGFEQFFRELHKLGPAPSLEAVTAVCVRWDTEVLGPPPTA